MLTGDFWIPCAPKRVTTVVKLTAMEKILVIDELFRISQIKPRLLVTFQESDPRQKGGQRQMN